MSQTIKCSCGTNHEIPDLEIKWEKGCSQRLEHFFSHSLFVADASTEKLVILPSDAFIFKEKRILASVDNSQRIISAARNYSSIVSIGSGSITDVVRYAAYLLNKPFFAFPTAPSVDGYTSSVAPLLVKNIKKTLPARPPSLILIDIEILKNSPLDLLKAGIGDIAAKITARLDWIVANQLLSERICDFTWDNLKDHIVETLKNTEKILERNENSIQNLMEGLLVSGLNIATVGHSRPASGAEHLISHLIEMYHEFHNQLPPFHGITVAMGTFVTMKAYEALLSNVKFERRKILDKRAALREFFNDEIAAEFEKIHKTKKMADKLDLKPVLKAIEKIYYQYSKLVFDALSKIDIHEFFKKYDKQFLKKLIILTNMTRERYTILDLLDQLGILDTFAEWILEEQMRY